MVLSAAFLAVAVTRRLHFDEALLVRSGWLLVGRVEAAPAFAMPATLAAGGLAHAVADPGDLFTFLRLATGLAVLAALAFAARRACTSGGQVAAAMALSLLSYAFVAHGLEFRYDAAILVGLLVAFGLVVRGQEADFAWLGACASLVAAHGVKGLFFGGALLAFGVARALGDRRALVRLAAGAAAAFGAWIALAVATGALPSVVGTYGAFARLGAGAARVWPWQSSLATTFVRDLAFWTVASAAGVSAVRVLRTRGADPRNEPETWALLFLAATLSFPFVHPLPWPYMLALPAPFAAILMVRRSVAWASGRARLPALALAAAALLVQMGVFQSAVGSAYWASIAAPREPEVAALRLLRRLGLPGDRVFDPSGLAYFLPPCTREWYLDTLFQPAAARGEWMADAVSLDPAACPWILFTYRLEMLPPAARVRLARDWERRAWGLGLRRGDGRLSELPPSRRDDELTTFW
jgi:hypothetical protein